MITSNIILNEETNYNSKNIDSSDLESFISFYKTQIKIVKNFNHVSNQNYKNQYNNSKKKKNTVYNSNNNKIETQISKSIKIILNKLTDKNYNILLESLKCELNKTCNISILDVIIEEIINKIVFDNSYHDLYVKLCKDIWDFRKWHLSLFTTEEDKNGNFYWTKNINVYSSENKFGPFKSEKIAIDDALSTLNFKLHLIDKIQDEFNNKITIEEKIEELSEDEDLNEDEIFKLKRKIYSIPEFISKLYIGGHLPISIIYSLIYQLIFYDDEIPEININCFINLIKALNSSYKILDDHKFVNLCFTRINNKNSSVRLKFLVNDIKNNYNKKYFSSKILQYIYSGIDRKSDYKFNLSEMVNMGATEELIVEILVDEIIKHSQQNEKSKIDEKSMNIINFINSQQKFFNNIKNNLNIILNKDSYQKHKKIFQKIQTFIN